MTWLVLYVAAGAIHLVHSLFAMSGVMKRAELTANSEDVLVVVYISAFVGAVGTAVIWPLSVTTQLAIAIYVRRKK